MKKLEKIIRRFKYIIHVVIALVGIILIIVARWFFNSSLGNMTYDVLISIGCSVIATAIITVFLLAVLPDDSEENAELIAWGINRIYDERRTAIFQANKWPRNQLDFIAFGLKHFRNANGYSSALLTRVRNGLHVRILTLHPNSEFVKKQEKLENTVNLKADIEELADWVKSMNARLGNNPKGSITIKFYDCIPLHFYCRADSRIWVGPYLPGIASNNAITYEFLAESKGGKLYEDAFQNYWDGKRNIHLVDQDNLHILGNQKRSIETVMEYFCNEMKKDDGTDIIGVVVLFKKNLKLRRTLFSCNKPGPEKHNCYGINDGAVGKMIELNNGASRALFFRDYTNDLSIRFWRQGRNSNVQKIDASLPPFKKDTDMSAILTAPICTGDQMVGAVTFDFNKLSSKYGNEVSQLKSLEFETDIASNSVLHSWFHMADSCAQIIEHMIGNEIEIFFKDLYEEEWKINGQV